MRKLLLFPIIVMISFIIDGCDKGSIFNEKDKEIINNHPISLFNIYTTDNKYEAPTLKEKSTDLKQSEIQSELFKQLTVRMMETVLDTNNPGVGIAAPQIGINKRVVVVQRFDKEEEPLEVYANIYITEYSPETEEGQEGCLSIPETSAKITRSKWIKITYTDPKTLEKISEKISGFTAVIFQHEIDHLEGVLFTDRAREEAKLLTVDSEI